MKSLHHKCQVAWEAWTTWNTKNHRKRKAADITSTAFLVPAAACGLGCSWGRLALVCFRAHYSLCRFLPPCVLRMVFCGGVTRRFLCIVCRSCSLPLFCYEPMHVLVCEAASAFCARYYVVESDSVWASCQACDGILPQEAAIPTTHWPSPLVGESVYPHKVEAAHELSKAGDPQRK